MSSPSRRRCPHTKCHPPLAGGETASNLGVMIKWMCRADDSHFINPTLPHHHPVWMGHGAGSTNTTTAAPLSSVIHPPPTSSQHDYSHSSESSFPPLFPICYCWCCWANNDRPTGGPEEDRTNDRVEMRSFTDETGTFPLF